TPGKWSRIRLTFDGYEGFIDTKQFQFISKETHQKCKSETPALSTRTIDFVVNAKNETITIPLGCAVGFSTIMGHTFAGPATSTKKEKAALVEHALQYLNAPYLWGGKTPFGIDCSGFTQMAHKLCGYRLLRDASQQAEQGQAIATIEESGPGDLAFFNTTGTAISHVGIIMKNRYIVHAHGHVRVDRLDQKGIYNAEKQQHTHKLCVIKRVIKKTL
ncbi:MAG: C40 family peptidase, partial [Marinirhabdus sp.]